MRGREREKPQPLLSPFTVIQVELSTHGSVLFFPLWALVQKGNARPVFKTGLGSSREAKGVCSHSVVGAFCIVVWTHFRPCCVSRCLRKSTFRWKPLPHRSQPKGLKPVCFRLWVMRLELWLKAFPHTWHLWGFSPASRRWERERLWKRQHAAYVGPQQICTGT